VDLILWRHAEAKDEREDQPDADRPLTPKGERQARRMAAWLNQHLPETTRVFVSPTLRTRQTVQYLDRKHRIAEALGPQGSVSALLQVARWPDAKEPILIVGHQDTLGLTAAYLMAGMTQPWSIRKGAVWWFRQRERRGQAEVILHLVAAPEYL
jgi:phosphohistidine phosphatase